MKTLIKKQMFSGFVIFALAGMMITSQMPMAFANDYECVNEILGDDEFLNGLHTNVIVPEDPGGVGFDGIAGTHDDGFNICVYDNLDHKGNIFIKDRAALFFTNGSHNEGDTKVEGQYSTIHFESTLRVDSEGEPIINTKRGNIQLAHDDSYAYIESLNLDGNINGKGELYISSNSDRFTGFEVFINGNILLDGNGDNELRVDGGEITGNLRVFKNHSYVVTNAIIGGNLDIKDAFNGVGSEFDEDSIIIIENNDIAGNLNFQDNTLSATINGNDVGGNVICKSNESVSGDSSTNWVGGKAKNDCKNLFDKDESNF